jgi:hypothetical protein
MEAQLTAGLRTTAAEQRTLLASRSSPALVPPPAATPDLPIRPVVLVEPPSPATTARAKSPKPQAQVDSVSGCSGESPAATQGRRQFATPKLNFAFEAVAPAPTPTHNGSEAAPNSRGLGPPARATSPLPATANTSGLAAAMAWQDTVPNAVPQGSAKTLSLQHGAAGRGDLVGSTTPDFYDSEDDAVDPSLASESSYV